MKATPIRVEHPSLPYGYADGHLTDTGRFIARRPGAGHLFDVWASVEAFTALRDEPAALVAGNVGSLVEAIEIAEGVR